MLGKLEFFFIELNLVYYEGLVFFSFFGDCIFFMWINLCNGVCCFDGKGCFVEKIYEVWCGFFDWEDV